MSAKKARLDVLVVEAGLADSRTQAQALIRAGKVLVADQVMDKPGTQVPKDANLRVTAKEHPYASRGGLKLAHGLEAFSVDPSGMVCADLGASTGGFTDCLLQHEAARVYAIDVGYGQLAWKLRQDPRVVVMERTNVRHLTSLPEPIDLIVADLSFISVTKVIPAMKRITQPGARGVILVKPQFEAGRDHIARGGVVRDEHARELARKKVEQQFEAQGVRVLDHAISPIRGAKQGNLEYLLSVLFVAHEVETNAQ